MSSWRDSDSNGLRQHPGYVPLSAPPADPAPAGVAPAPIAPPPPTAAPYTPGPNDIVCFYIQANGKAVERLRRYGGEGTCSKTGRNYHDVEVEIARDVPFDADRKERAPVPEDDPRWPTTCACGYEFQPDDHWQFNHLALYEDYQSGRTYSIWGSEPPVGAMWLAPWYGMTGPGGTACLVVRTPGGDWLVDGDGHSLKWDREGVPPRITARPSILFKIPKLDANGKLVLDADGHTVMEDGYHANLIDGVLRR